MDFFYISLEEIDDNLSEQIRYNSLSHRLSKLEQKDFDSMMNDGSDKKKTKKAPIVVDHEAQMATANARIK